MRPFGVRQELIGGEALASYRYFGEYELSPSLIGLSLLPTAHPSTFQRKPVRASSVCYRTFTLAMGRSLGFASACADSLALLRLALATAPDLKSLTLPTQRNS